MLPRVLAALVAVSWAAVCADEAPDERGRRTLYIQHVEQVEALSDDASGKAFALLGRVDLEARSLFSIRAQRMVVWLHPDTDATIFEIVRGLRGAPEGERGVPLWAVRAVYAEGGRAPAVFQTDGRIFRCSSFYYDFDTHRGVWLDAQLRLRRAPDRTELPDLVLRAKKFRATGPGAWRGEDVEFFSSNYHEHEVTLEVERVVIEDRSLREALGRLTRISARDYREGRGPTRAEVDEVLDAMAASGMGRGRKSLSLYGITGRAYGVPFARWRRVDIDGDDVLPLRVEAEAGSEGDLGTGVRLGVGLATKPVGFMAGVAYYERRGPLFDLRLDVDAFDGRVHGSSFGVYMHDHGDDRGVVPNTRDRYWTKNQYRWRISELWRLDVEAADLSDSAWLRTYDEREFKEGKEQETLAYLRRRGARTYLTLTGKVQTIGFQNTLEELPRFAAVLPVFTLLRFGETGRGEPVTLQLAGSIVAGNYHFRPNDTSPLADFRTARVDLDPTLYVSFNVGPVRIVPFGTFRVTAWENALDGEDEGRFVGTAGVRADLRLSRWFGGVLHVANVSVEYIDAYTVTDPASAFFPLDATEMVTPYERLGVRVRNRLLKRRPQGLREFLSFELFGAWFPDRQQELGRMGDGFIEGDLEWRPRDNLAFTVHGEVDTELGRLQTASGGGWWRPSSRVRVGAEVRHLEGDSDILTTTAEFEVDRRWRIVTFSQVDFKTSDGLDQGVLIQRLGKTAVVGVRIKYDPGGEDFGISVKVDLLEKFRRKQRKRAEDARREIHWK